MQPVIMARITDFDPNEPKSAMRLREVKLIEPAEADDLSLLPLRKTSFPDELEISGSGRNGVRVTVTLALAGC